MLGFSKFLRKSVPVSATLFAVLAGCTSVAQTQPSAGGGPLSVHENTSRQPKVNGLVATPRPNIAGLPKGTSISQIPGYTPSQPVLLYPSNKSQLFAFRAKANGVKAALTVSPTARISVSTYGSYIASLPSLQRAHRLDVDPGRVVYIVVDRLTSAKKTVGSKEFLPGSKSTTLYDAASGDILAMRLDGSVATAR